MFQRGAAVLSSPLTVSSFNNLRLRKSIIKRFLGSIVRVVFEKTKLYLKKDFIPCLTGFFPVAMLVQITLDLVGVIVSIFPHEECFFNLLRLGLELTRNPAAKPGNQAQTP